MRGERRFGSGIKTDCEILLNEFVKTENVRYEDFVHIWRNINFSFVYFGLKHQVDQRDFTREAFEVASNFLMLPYTFQVRVGALYLLYGLYFTQIHDPKIKIRMSLNRWHELVGLHEDIHKQQHLDAEFVFLKLKVERAFMITATPKSMFYRRKFGKSAPDTSTHMRQPHSILAEFIDNDSLENLEHIHKKYEYLKMTLKGAEDQSLKIVKESMSTFINSNIQEFLDQQSLVCGQTSDDGNEQQKHSTDEEEESQITAAHERACRIAKIKAKSFHSGVLSPQHQASKQDIEPTTSTWKAGDQTQVKTDSTTDMSYVHTGECILSMPTLGDEKAESGQEIVKPKREGPRKGMSKGSSVGPKGKKGKKSDKQTEDGNDEKKNTTNVKKRGRKCKQEDPAKKQKLKK